MRRILTTALAGLTALGAWGAVAQTGTGSPPERTGDRPQMMQGGGHTTQGGGQMMQGGGQMMQGDGMTHGGKMGDRRARGGHDGPPPAMMKMMFAIADGDGDGKVSLEEMQEIHARIFRSVDEDGSGGVTPEEIRSFMGSGRMPSAAMEEPATSQE